MKHSFLSCDFKHKDPPEKAGLREKSWSGGWCPLQTQHRDQAS